MKLMNVYPTQMKELGTITIEPKFYPVTVNTQPLDEQNDDDLLEASFGGINVKKYMSAGGFTDFSNDKKGFYAVYRDFFEKIKAQEAKSFKQGDFNHEIYNYPGFGDSKTDPKLVNDFYVKWENFSTYKNFSWADQYRDDEESRYVRRIIERENNKFRKKEKKNYLDTIKKIVDFAFKKDPRYEAWVKLVEEEKERKQKFKEEQKIEKEKQKKDMRKQQRLIEQQRLQEEEELIKKGLKVVENYEQFDHIREEDDLPDFYCQICDKEYKNGNALENHKQSKMHKKNLKLLLDEVGTEEEKQAIINADKMKPKEKTEKLEEKSEKMEEKNEENQDIQNEEEQQEECDMPNTKNKKKSKKNKNKQFLQQAQQFIPDVDKFYKKQSSDEDMKEKEKFIQQKEEIPKRKKTSVDESEDDDQFFQMMNKKIQKKQNKKQQKQEEIPQEEIIQQKEEKQEIPQQQEVVEPQNKEENISIENIAKENIAKEEIIFEKKQPAKKKGKLEPKEPTIQPNQSKLDQAKNGDIDISELSKAKQKKLKKLEKEELEKDVKFRCNVCKAGFPSKTKLFKHCEAEGHNRAL